MYFKDIGLSFAVTKTNFIKKGVVSVSYLLMLFLPATLYSQTANSAIGRVVVVSSVDESSKPTAKVCTGFIIESGHILSSAHCFRNVKQGTVRACFVEFNSPGSSPSGGLVLAKDQDRYMIESIITTYGQIDGCVIHDLGPEDKPKLDEDWAILVLKKNQDTRRLPKQQQDSYFRLGTFPPYQNSPSFNLQFTGFPKLGGDKNYVSRSVAPSNVAYFFKKRPLIIFQRKSIKGDSGAPLFSPDTQEIYGIVTGNLKPKICEKYLGIPENCSIAVSLESQGLLDQLGEITAQ